MNVIIPMGGLGARFSSSGYRYPKPLINIVGRPMIMWLLDNLLLTAEDTLWVALNHKVDSEFMITQQLRKEFPKLAIESVPLFFETGGAAETLYIVLRSMSEEDLGKKTISLDCDTIYFSDVLEDFRNSPPASNVCFYFEDSGSAPIFSYITFGPDGETVVDIREKVAISTHANTGAYGFESGTTLMKYCDLILNEGVGQAGEYYISSVFKRALADGLLIKGIHVADFSCVGTPLQLRAFQQKVAGNPSIVKKRRFCFDLDGTLVSFPVVAGDYSTVQPIWRNIKLLQQLKAAGHHIVIYTARRMKTHNGNVSAVLQDVGLLTLKTWEELGIRYDEIYFGKPYADVYVDDLAVSSLVDTEKEIGWDAGDVEDPGANLKYNIIKPRSFNTVQVDHEVVHKSSSSDELRGEIFFYQHVPADLYHLFPRLHSVTMGPRSSSITIERIPGTTFSHLLISRCLNDGRLIKLLDALRQIHTSKGASLGEVFAVDIYAVYEAKVQARFEENKGLYEDIAEDCVEVYNSLITKLHTYEQERRGLPCPVIHGDPVFSNVLLTRSSEVKLIDMRGMIGTQLTQSGDALYDLAKVFQSLCGYDFILQDQPKSACDDKVQDCLQRTFWEYLHVNYSTTHQDDIRLITASLFFSLIPLHEGQERQACFFRLSKQILEGVI